MVFQKFFSSIFKYFQYVLKIFYTKYKYLYLNPKRKSIFKKGKINKIRNRNTIVQYIMKHNNEIFIWFCTLSTYW